MTYDQEYEREIDLKDLIFHVLYRWRSCVVAALAGAPMPSRNDFEHMSVN